jgi:hypothetical protein
MKLCTEFSNEKSMIFVYLKSQILGGCFGSDYAHPKVPIKWLTIIKKKYENRFYDPFIDKSIKGTFL